MVIQTLGRPKRNFANEIMAGIGGGLNVASQMMGQQKQKQEREQAIKQLGLDPSILQLPEQAQAEYFKQAFAPEKKMTSLQETQQRLAEERLKSLKGQQGLIGRLSGKTDSAEEPESRIRQLPEDVLLEASAHAGQPSEMGVIGNMAKSELDRRKTQEQQKRKTFESERQFHTGFSKEQEKEAENLRQSIPKKEMALNFARNAIETGNLSYLSPDKLADVTGIDLFRTAKGAQLVTAGKENLLSNMGRVSSKAQNIWFEQRLNSMFPKVGQSNEANLTVQEMLEGEVALDKAYLDTFDKVSKEDEDKYGFVKKDASKRSREQIKPLEKEIFKRTTYRMKEIEEQEKGLPSIKKEVGKNVIKGTPLTLAMAKLYKDKFGENALDVAKKNGYYIPTLEEFKIFQQRPEEFREELTQ